MDKFTSRFFLNKDNKKETFIFELNSAWWSRPYEYAWAAEFADSNDVALDAASGISHPLKFFLADQCCEAHACDLDERILNPPEILEDIANDFGEEAANNFSEKYFNKVRFTKSSITNTPYGDKTFDKIYCISVLEHLEDAFNKKPQLFKIKLLSRFLSCDISNSLKEFRRILKDDGLILLTFDYPDINLSYLKDILPSIGLEFSGESNFDIPDDALYSQEKNLYCFRAVLRKIG